MGTQNRTAAQNEGPAASGRIYLFNHATIIPSTIMPIESNTICCATKSDGTGYTGK